MRFKFSQKIGQLPANRGAYFYVKIMASTVDKFKNKRKTRLVIEIDNCISYSCGLNHYGDGNFFIIIATKYLKRLKKQIGDKISFEIFPDPNPLGVEVPEVLSVLIEQDEEVKEVYNKITDGKKRSLIYLIKPIKNIDLQIKKIYEFINQEKIKLLAKQKA